MRNLSKFKKFLNSEMGRVLLVLFNLSFLLQRNAHCASASMALRSVDFEVFGRVQGVFFRKYTKAQAEKLNLKGWCRNTSRGTVEGQMQGPSQSIDNITPQKKRKINLWAETVAP